MKELTGTGAGPPSFLNEVKQPLGVSEKRGIHFEKGYRSPPRSGEELPGKSERAPFLTEGGAEVFPSMMSCRWKDIPSGILPEVDTYPRVCRAWHPCELGDGSPGG